MRSECQFPYFESNAHLRGECAALHLWIYLGVQEAHHPLPPLLLSPVDSPQTRPCLLSRSSCGNKEHWTVSTFGVIVSVYSTLFV